MKLTINTKNILIPSIFTNIVLIVFRSVFLNGTNYYFLIWNLFLAALPLLISYRITRSFDIKKITTWLWFFLWILFLPNAPYIVTDFVHLENGSQYYWIDLLIIVLTAINGMLMGFISLKQIVTIFSFYFSKPLASTFEIVVITASAYGVYMGRFMRYNSWDIFIKPYAMARDIYHSVGEKAILFVIIFSLVSYLLYKIFRVTLLPYSQEVS
jgi:uncharacterized membrane protein